MAADFGYERGDELVQAILAAQPPADTNAFTAEQSCEEWDSEQGVSF